MKSYPTERPGLRWLSATLAASVAAIALASPAPAQVGVYLGTPPPPLRYERRPVAPGPGYVWTDGYWQPKGRRYVWHPGFWQQPPYPGAFYSHPHYDHYQQGWAFHDGHWDHEDHGDHHDDNRGDDHREGDRPH